MNNRRLYAALLIALAIVLAGSAVATPAGTEKTEPNDRQLLVGSMGSGWDGTVTAYEGDSIKWKHTGARSYNGVVRLNESAALVAYQDAREGLPCDPYPKPCEETGVQILRTNASEPRVAWDWSMPVRTGRNSEVHDAEPVPDGILIADMDRERVFILDQSTESIVWQWNASQHYQPPADPTTRDWLHINDVDAIGEGRYLVSVRNANQLLILKRGEGVVEVINRDHGGPDSDCRGIRDNQLVGDDPRCGDDSVLDHQHNPQWLGDGRVLVADSENHRIVELQRQSDGDWTVAWQRGGAGGVAFDWPRDADRLPNGNTLVQDTRNRRVVELAPNGSVVHSQQVPAQSYDADIGSEYPAGNGYHQVSSQTVIRQPVALIGAVYGGLRHSLPWLPLWFGSWQLLAVVAVVSAITATEASRELRTLYREVIRRDDPVSPESGQGEQPADTDGGNHD